jgi:hypothetical protein
VKAHHNNFLKGGRIMSCENCSHLKIKALNYPELLQKWQDIYAPTCITEGYEKRLRREAKKLGIPFEKAKLRFVYCSEGILHRFYIVRSEYFIKGKNLMGQCKFYS